MTDPQASDPFEYLQQMSTQQDGPSVESVLQAIAKPFNATGLGISSFSDLVKDMISLGVSSVPKKRPWQTDGDLAAKIRASLFAIAHQDTSGQWLMAAVLVPQRDETMLVWAHRPSNAWSESERWQWLNASHALVRWYSEEGIKAENVAITQSRLEASANISSRLAHEFGNFLTGIMGFTELAQSRAGTDNTLAMYLHEVMLSANQGAEWIRRLHKFCRRGRGPTWPTHLPSLLLAAESREQAQDAKQRLIIDLPADLPLLAIDAAAMQSIFDELASNAKEAAKDKGTLSVRAAVKQLSATDCRNVLGSLSPGDCVEITVQDDGPGFSPDARTKLFREPFYSSKPRHRGTGLLAVYGTLQRFNGGFSVDFESGAPGTCLRLYLPIAKLAEPPAPTGKSPQVLIVHSDTNLLESIRSVLLSVGLRVTTVNASAAAMSTFQLAKPPFNLVIAETTMPKVSGFELARRILDHHSKAQFLFLSAQASYHDLAEEDMLKRFAILRWPIEISELVQAVEKALNNPAS